MPVYVDATTGMWLFNSIIHQGTTPEAWHRSVVVLFSKKGYNTKLNNYTPISLLSHVYSRVITNSLTIRSADFQPPERASFRKGFSIIDSVETWDVLRSLQRCRVCRKTPLYQSVYRTRIRDRSNCSEGHGDVISLKLFTAALEDVFKLLDWNGLDINNNGEYITQLRFADYEVIMAYTLGDFIAMLTNLSRVSQLVGIRMNILASRKLRLTLMQNLKETDEKLKSQQQSTPS
ncbi:jg3433 [Pararge aegeria aegeria]|uniref:Jg3433 protein n=1 Tax=Pararge aegeria aegeria TaxID=348720 RepID=A0A8S4RP44_9NEOP|nr:jg3433 [Pararge aegeria aegeria]